MKKFLTPLLGILLLAALPLRAQEHAPTFAPAHMEAAHSEAAHAEAGHAEADAQPHPALSQDSSWAGAMVIIILGMFLAAAVIGPIVRANMPEEVAPAHSHDEPPGSSGHHGRSGRTDHNAPEAHGGGHGH